MSQRKESGLERSRPSRFTTPGQRKWVARVTGLNLIVREEESEEFPGSPVVRVSRFHCQGRWLIPGQGTKILQAGQCGQKKKKKRKKEKEKQESD